MLLKAVTIVNPWTLWVVYITIYFVDANKSEAYEFGFLSFIVGILLMFCLTFSQFLWPALLYKVIRTKRADLNISRLPIFCGLYLVSIFIIGPLTTPIATFIEVEIPQMLREIFSTVILVTALLSIVYIYWLTAVALCEEENMGSIKRKIITFLQFFYLPIGIFFLHKRVKKVLSSTI